MKDIFERTLVITPHLDDETIGCGGTIYKIVNEYNGTVKVVSAAKPRVFKALHSGEDVDPDERLTSFQNAMSVLGVKNYEFLSGYEDGYMDRVPLVEMVSQLDHIISVFEPTAVLFPYSSHHQDHKYVNQASIAALRPMVSTNFIKLKAMYEYPYITGWNDSLVPTSKLYITLDNEDIETKRKALLKYDSQLNRGTRDILDISSILSLAETRGREIGEYFAEVFYIINVVL